MNTHQTILAFYRGLARLFLSCDYHNERPDDKFDEKLATDLLSLHREIKSLVSIKDYSVELMHDVSDERDRGEAPWELVRCAFNDLAPHLRDPEVQKVVKSFQQLLWNEDRELLVKVKSARLLGKSKKGPSVVTIIASNHALLMNLLSRETENTDCLEVHLVDKAKF